MGSEPLQRQEDSDGRSFRPPHIDVKKSRRNRRTGRQEERRRNRRPSPRRNRSAALRVGLVFFSLSPLSVVLLVSIFLPRARPAGVFLRQPLLMLRAFAEFVVP
jgi:hypothetical protein